MKCNCIKAQQACKDCVENRLIDFWDNWNWDYWIEHIDKNPANNAVNNLRLVENLIIPKEEQVHWRDNL